MHEINDHKTLYGYLFILLYHFCLQLIKLSCHSTLILFHTLEELAVYLEKCKIFKVPLIVHHQPSITWSDAVECFLPHESWGDIADLLTEEGPLRYLMVRLFIYRVRVSFGFTDVIRSVGSNKTLRQDNCQ